MAGITNLLQLILPKRKSKTGGTAVTPTFNVSAPQQVIPVPGTQDHLTDIFETRIAQDANALMRFIAKNDPDVSAAFNAYLTLSNTEPLFFVRDVNGEIDRNADKLLRQLLVVMTHQTDYTLGFQMKPSLKSMCESLRYMNLLRGACMGELVVNKQLVPAEIRLVDPLTIQWFEAKAGEYKPMQSVAGASQLIDLDIPTFFASYYRRDPLSIYPTSTFISAINTISARQQVINELYRITRATGWPRIDLKIVEEVLIKTAPGDVKADPTKLRAYVGAQLTGIANQFANIRSDQAFVHTDSVEAKVINEKSAGVSINMDSVIGVLNAQNQAALKTVATVLGRGDNGVNTASVETRVFSMNADELNMPVAEFLSRVLTTAMQILGQQVFIEVRFRKAELRPDLELEPQLTMRQSRLQKDLSLGIITDDDYHIQMYNQIRPDAAPELSGTGFLVPTSGAPTDPNANDTPPGSDPVARAVTPKQRGAQRSSQVQPGKGNNPR